MYASEYLEFASSQILQSYFSLNVALNYKYLMLACIFYCLKITLVKFSKSFLIGLLTLEDGTDTLSRNVRKQLPYDAA
jgi:hypothetical protein